MLKATRDLIRRLGFVGGLALALVFATPALESHACAAEALATADGVVSVAVAAPDHGETCPDCGPACAATCCHAPHMAIAPDLSASGGDDIERSKFWTHQDALAAVRPSGPDQPPRL